MPVNSTDTWLNNLRFLKIKLSLEILLVIIIWMAVLLAIPRGFDLSDNGFYLMSFRHYQDVSAPFSMFGAFIKPIYDLTGGSVAATRLLGGLILLLASALTAFISIHRIKNPYNVSSPARYAEYQRYSSMTLLIVAGSLYYIWWLTTPSYNWLNLIGLMLFWAGLLLWLSNRNQKDSLYGAFLLGLACCFVVWARVTTAPFLLIFVALLLGVNRQRYRELVSFQHIGSGLAGLIVGFLPLLLQGDFPPQIVDKMQAGIEFQSLKSATYSSIATLFNNEASKIFEFILTSLVQLWIIWPWWALLGSVVIILSVMTRRTTAAQQLPLTRIIGLALAAGWVVTVVVITGSIHSFLDMGLWGLLIYEITLVFILTGHFSDFIIGHRSGAGYASLLSCVAWSAAALTFNIIFSFGSTNIYSIQTGLSSYFYFLAAVILAGTTSYRLGKFLQAVLPLTLICAMGYSLLITSQLPYRQEVSMLAMTTPAPLRWGQETVQVGPQTAHYLTQLQQLALEAGFSAGTPVIDLTGHSPGTVYALDGRTYVFPWIIGGYEGSTPASQWLLEQWSEEELRRAWVLTVETDPLRAIPSDVLRRLGLNFPLAYERVGDITTPHFQEVQTLWKPRVLASAR